jgi:hypothetical protein
MLSHGIMGQVHIPKVDTSLFYLHQLCLQLLCSIVALKSLLVKRQTPEQQFSGWLSVRSCKERSH